MNPEIRSLFAKRRRAGILGLASLTPFLLCGSTAPTGCQDAKKPNYTGPIVGISAGVAVGVIVLVAVSKSHHNIKGCVATGPNGLEVQVPNDKGFETYDLTGTTSDIKEGDLVRVHGAKEKRKKDAPGDRVFKVEKLSKDYGPCKALPKPAADSVSPAE